MTLSTGTRIFLAPAILFGALTAIWFIPQLLLCGHCSRSAACGLALGLDFTLPLFYTAFLTVLHLALACKVSSLPEKYHLAVSVSAYGVLASVAAMVFDYTENFILVRSMTSDQASWRNSMHELIQNWASWPKWIFLLISCLIIIGNTLLVMTRKDEA